MKRYKMVSTSLGRILELPQHLISYILSRLTTETIFSCKCVCKTFLEILTDAHFVELRLITAPNVDNGIIIQNRKNISDFLLVYNNELGKPHSDKANGDSRPCQTLAVPTDASKYYNEWVYIVGSCNGLLCLYYIGVSVVYKYYICNPILGEFFSLPPQVQHNDHGEISGFGFCPKTKQYKVIRFITPSSCSIYTLGTYSWKLVGDTPPYPRSIGAFDSSLNGNLHWTTKTTNLSNLICCFNLETEKFSYISAPIHLNPDDIESMSMAVGVLDGLFCFYYFLGSKFEAFVLKDYGPKGCWTTKFSVNLNSSGFNMKGYFLAFLNNGELVLKRDLYTLIYCNLRRRTTGYVLAEKNVSSHRVLSFIPSFVSLKDLAGSAVGYVEIVQRKMGRNLWTDDGFKFIPPPLPNYHNIPQPFIENPNPNPQHSPKACGNLVQQFNFYFPNIGNLVWSQVFLVRGSWNEPDHVTFMRWLQHYGPDQRTSISNHILGKNKNLTEKHYLETARYFYECFLRQIPRVHPGLVPNHHHPNAYGTIIQQFNHFFPSIDNFHWYEIFGAHGSWSVAHHEEYMMWLQHYGPDQRKSICDHIRGKNKSMTEKHHLESAGHFFAAFLRHIPRVAHVPPP